MCKKLTAPAMKAAKPAHKRKPMAFEPALDTVVCRFKANYKKTCHNPTFLHELFDALERRKGGLLREISSNPEAVSLFERAEKELDETEMALLAKALWNIDSISSSRLGRVISILHGQDDLSASIGFAQRISGEVMLFLAGRGDIGDVERLILEYERML